ncbi:hypothetical protein Tco_0890899 [Tanacetum coccineum]|uniref:F-box associated domain-containing protein n=1 Tax=Tanacetum coccineum TaxID=301880 RepID=A0ABQ5C3K2_9ASTR
MESRNRRIWAHFTIEGCDANGNIHLTYEADAGKDHDNITSAADSSGGLLDPEIKRLLSIIEMYGINVESLKMGKTDWELVICDIKDLREALESGIWLESENTDSKQEGDKDVNIILRPVMGDEDESHLLNLPLHVLGMVMEFSVGVEYLKFRSACKTCHFAAPLIPWNNGKASKRLQKYSLPTPWLIAFDKHKGIITFTDPMFGDKYFITPQELICDFKIKGSSFSVPPTSPDLFGRDLYDLRDDRGLDVFDEMVREDQYSWKPNVAKAPTSCCASLARSFLLRCDQHLLHVIMGKFGESVEVFKFDDCTQEWVKIYSLGRHDFYLWYHTCSNKNLQETFGDFFGTEHLLTPHAWIEPTWS